MATAPSQLRVEAERLEADGVSGGLATGWVDDYEELWREREELRRRVERLEARVREAAAPAKRERSRSRPLALVLHLAFVVLCAVALLTTAAMIAVVGGLYGVEEEAKPSASAAPPPAMHDRQASGGASGAVASATPATPERRDAAAPGLPVLRVTAARGESWLRVTDVSRAGKVLFEGVLARGRSTAFEGERLALRVGAPENLDAALDGEPVRLPDGTADVVVEAGRIRVVSSG